MRRCQIVAWGAPLEMREYPTPRPQGTEVLLRVTAAGVCHSDLHIHRGHFDLGGGRRLRFEERGIRLPFTMGHEVAGEVVELGPEAPRDRVVPGREYVVHPWIGCGRCRTCAQGVEHHCPQPRFIGTVVDGGYGDFLIVPHPRYLVPFDGLPRELACTFACSGVTAWNALRKVRDLDRPLLLLGVGGVGGAALAMSRLLVEVPVAVADVAADKRARALEAGAVAAFDPADPGAARAVREWSEGGVGAVIDFVGRPETVAFALDCLVPKGGTVVVVGLHGDRLELPVPFLPLRALTLRGSYVGGLDDLRAVIDHARAGRIPPIPVTPRPLEEANAALADLAAGRVAGRQVLIP